MINHEFDIIRVLIASQDDEMIKKLILCLTENAYETVTVNNKTDARKLDFEDYNSVKEYYKLDTAKVTKIKM